MDRNEAADQAPAKPEPPAPAEVIAQAPRPGETLEIADGVWLCPMAVPFPPGFVMALALADRQDGVDGWTIIDPGYARAETTWKRHLDGFLSGRPVFRIIATHFHPDHLGAAGWLQRRTGAAFWTTRTSYLAARMLQLDGWRTAPEAARAFQRRLGYDAGMLARYEARAAVNFSVTVSPLPLGYRRFAEGDVLTIGARRFEVLIGDGHAPEHALLWDRDDGLLIAGDQILPEISPNISVYPMEPEAEPLGEWIESCDRLGAQLPDDLTVIPGHGPVFRGGGARCREMAARARRRLDRLAAFLKTAEAAVSVVEATRGVYARPIPEAAEGLASGETLAHLNRLTAEGRARRAVRSDGVWVWTATDG